MILAAARANGENCATTPPFRNGVPNLHVLQCNDDIRRRLAMADISRSFPNAAMCPRPPVDQTTAIRTTRVALSGRVGSTHHEMQRAFAPPSLPQYTLFGDRPRAGHVCRAGHENPGGDRPAGAT